MGKKTLTNAHCLLELIEKAHVANLKDFSGLPECQALARGFDWSQEAETLPTALIDHVRHLRKEQRDPAEREADLATASRIKYGEIPALEKKLATARAELAKIPESERMLREEVTPDDIAAVVARWTGIPVERLMETEGSKLAKLEEAIGERVSGQTRAVTSIANAIRRSRAGLADTNRPIG